MAFEGIYVSPQSCRMATPCQATGDFTPWKMTQARESEICINQPVGELLNRKTKKISHSYWACWTGKHPRSGRWLIGNQLVVVSQEQSECRDATLPNCPTTACSIYILCNVQGILLGKHTKWTFAPPFVWLSNVKIQIQNENIHCVSMANLIYSHLRHLYLNIVCLFLIFHETKIVNKMPLLASPRHITKNSSAWRRIHPKIRKNSKAEKQWRICDSLR